MTQQEGLSPAGKQGAYRRPVGRQGDGPHALAILIPNMAFLPMAQKRGRS